MYLRPPRLLSRSLEEEGIVKKNLLPTKIYFYYARVIQSGFKARDFFSLACSLFSVSERNNISSGSEVHWITSDFTQFYQEQYF